MPQEVIRAYNLQRKLAQLKNSLITSQRHGATPHPVTKISHIGTFPPTTPGLDIIRTGWAIQTIEQAVNLDIYEPTIHISLIPTFCQQHQDKLHEKASSKHTFNQSPAIPGHSNFPTTCTTSTDDDEDPPLTQEPMRLNASTIYPWITEFEESPKGPNGKQPLKEKQRHKSTPTTPIP
ncbi:hypothetical protein CHS0354_034556 [Potamilus streckersoni]|uniref:Uncharacterized protein n=1 Tax=Potamilus streckersoni TaxID=2493646 RepID=A0AAE0W2S8_9BIVA|nr:hypothetical protein CHS0354_034556 [Potamilus streckersoni]